YEDFSQNYDLATNTMHFTPPAPARSWPDGNYHGYIGSPLPRDRFGNPLGAADANHGNGETYQFDFFFLTGDANHDRHVDTIDFNILAANFSQTGKTFNQGNFDYSADGKVDTLDFNLLAANFSKYLAPPPAPAAALASALARAPIPVAGAQTM